MNSIRTIEITAKSEDEALALVERELQETEAIISSEVVSAPAKGIFGLVGKPEYKVRFSIGAKTEESANKVETETNTAPETSDEQKTDVYKQQVQKDHNKRREYENYQNNDLNDTPERKKEDVTENIKNHPEYSRIYELIKEVALNVGVENLELVEYKRDGAWVIEASGENVSQLIGKRGKTLDSLQYLMNIVLNKGREERIKLVIDAQGYREKRYRNLMILANRMCRKALATRRNVELEPMSTLDRRTIHMALKDRTDIETFSKGAEPMRRVVITSVKSKRKGSQNASRSANSGWQPAEIISDFSDGDDEEVPTSVPMFMEEDV